MGRTAQILVTQGAQLKTQPSISLDSVGPANFTVIRNMRRSRDQLVRREGWITFAPMAGTASAQYTFDATAEPTRLAELVRGDGTKVIVGASATKIKYFDTASPGWTTIATVATSALPWQAVSLSNVLILNRGVVGELPYTYEVGDVAALPLYEAREQGIASAGRIDSYNGFLFLGDIVEIQADQLTTFMAGYSSFTVASTSAKVANFSISAPADNRVQFNVTTGGSTITATLPTMTPLAAPFYVWIAKADAGVGTVATSPLVDDEVVVLDSINDIALVWWNGSRWVARVFPSGTIPSTTPYGIPPDEILQHIPDEQAWSELGEPKNWAPLLGATMAAASTIIYLPFIPQNWVAGQTRVAVVGGGPDGGTLGGQTDSPDGILITAIGAFSAANMGYAITLETTTDTANTYPLHVDVLRWQDVSAFTGKQRLGNGSRITAMFPLNGQQIISHEHGFFVNRFTANLDAPMALREKYQGANVPMNGDCIAAYNSELIIYPTHGRNFYSFDGIADPIIHRLCDDAKDLFFDDLVDTDRIWAVNNPLTQELWFLRPDLVMAYCYDPDSFGVSEMDAQIDAAVFATKPDADEKWFVLGLANLVMVYGMENGVATTWFRNDVATTAQLTSGLAYMGTHSSEKSVLSFTPLLGSASPDTDFEVQLRTTHNANAALTDLLDPVAELPDPEGDNLIPIWFQGNYFQDELEVVDEEDVDFRFIGRVWEFEVVGGQVGVNRSTV